MGECVSGLLEALQAHKGTDKAVGKTTAATYKCSHGAGVKY